jgi:hypothetical protein
MSSSLSSCEVALRDGMTTTACQEVFASARAVRLLVQKMADLVVSGDVRRVEEEAES